MQTIQRLCILSLLVAAAAMNTSCALIALQDPSGTGHLTWMGADNVTAWALRQTDVNKIGDALHALAVLADRQSEGAVRGFLKIYAKLLHGWPNLRESEWVSRESLMGFVYAFLANRGAKNVPDATEAFYSIRPTNDQPELKAYWLAAKSHLDRPENECAWPEE